MSAIYFGSPPHGSRMRMMNTLNENDERPSIHNWETNTKTKGADRTVGTDGKDGKDRIGRTDKTNI